MDRDHRNETRANRDSIIFAKCRCQLLHGSRNILLVHKSFTMKPEASLMSYSARSRCFVHIDQVVCTLPYTMKTLITNETHT